MQDKRILLIIGGGIAAYKALELIRLIKAEGAQVRAILTKGGAEFITPLSVSSLSGEKVYTDLFSLTDESEMGHIRLSREADLVVVAPATANLIAKMAGGLADDLASTALLATDKPVMVCPAMNAEMWAKPATQRNIKQLLADGHTMIGPDDGELACGEVGPGRLREPQAILGAIQSFFNPAHRPLQGLKALVTAGPTHEAIDPVRYIANRSSGKQGYAISAALAALGAETTLVSGPTHLAAPRGVNRVMIESAVDMLRVCNDHLPVDVAVCVAAVADWRPATVSDGKIKKLKGDNTPALSLVENPDILASLSAAGNKRPRYVVGFAAETDNLIDHAKAKLAKKGCDLIIANDVSGSDSVMGGDHNSVSLVSANGIESWPTSSKIEVAQKLAHYIAAAIEAR